MPDRDACLSLSSDYQGDPHSPTLPKGRRGLEEVGQLKDRLGKGWHGSSGDVSLRQGRPGERSSSQAWLFSAESR